MYRIGYDHCAHNIISWGTSLLSYSNLLVIFVQIVSHLFGNSGTRFALKVNAGFEFVESGPGSVRRNSRQEVCKNRATAKPHDENLENFPQNPQKMNTVQYSMSIVRLAVERARE